MYYLLIVPYKYPSVLPEIISLARDCVRDDWFHYEISGPKGIPTNLAVFGFKLEPDVRLFKLLCEFSDIKPVPVLKETSNIKKIIKQMIKDHYVH